MGIRCKGFVKQLAFHDIETAISISICSTSLTILTTKTLYLNLVLLRYFMTYLNPSNTVNTVCTTNNQRQVADPLNRTVDTYLVAIHTPKVFVPGWHQPR